MFSIRRRYNSARLFLQYKNATCQVPVLWLQQKEPACSIAFLFVVVGLSPIIMLTPDRVVPRKWGVPSGARRSFWKAKSFRRHGCTPPLKSRKPTNDEHKTPCRVLFLLQPCSIVYRTEFLSVLVEQHKPCPMAVFPAVSVHLRVPFAGLPTVFSVLQFGYRYNVERQMVCNAPRIVRQLHVQTPPR